MIITPTDNSFTGRSTRPTACSILHRGVLVEVKIAAMPKITKTLAAVSTVAVFPPSEYKRDIIGFAITESPNPAGMVTSIVILITDSMLALIFFGEPSVQALVTDGRALMPKVWVIAGISIISVAAYP